MILVFEIAAEPSWQEDHSDDEVGIVADEPPTESQSDGPDGDVGAEELLEDILCETAAACFF